MSKAGTTQQKGTPHNVKSNNALNAKDTDTKQICAQRSHDVESVLRNMRPDNAIEGKPNALIVKAPMRPGTMSAHTDKKKTNDWKYSEPQLHQCLLLIYEHTTTTNTTE